MERRNVIGGALAGLTSVFAAPDAGEPAQRASANNENDELVAAAIDDLRKSLERQFDACELGPCAPIDAIRQQQRVFLRSSQKYPDFIEVGLEVWESVYDWHLKHRQAVNAGRLPDGRYAMVFMFTNLLLRPDQAGSYVGYGFDGDTPPRPAAPVP
jgi:hypothetical protein